MPKLKTAWRFVRDYWYIPVLLIGTLVGWLALRGKGQPNPMRRVRKELDAIQAKRQVREEVLRQGAEVATKRIEQDYRATLTLLDAKAAKKAKELRNDPERLAAHLERVSR